MVNLYQPLFNFISAYVRLEQEHQLELERCLSIKKYQKGHLLIKEGQIDHQLQFVLSGLYRVYELKDGKDITIYFNTSLRNPFVASFVSLLTQKPSQFRIECIEEGELISIDYSDWQKVYQKSHALSTFGRLMAEFNYVLAMERIESLQHQSATDRYLQFITQYPNLLNQIPHHYIASYLGVTPESMSRIRKSILKGN